MASRFFEHSCYHCETTDEVDFVESGPHIKMVCVGCYAYIKFIKKSDLPALRDVKKKILEICLGDLKLVEQAKKERGLVGISDNFFDYWKLYLFLRE